MTTKTFLVKFTSDDMTRWTSDDAQLQRNLDFIATSMAAGMTEGSRPAVTVTKEHEPDLFRDNAGRG